MRERKYTLPRHTNLASNGQRTGAFLIDLGITALLSATFLFLCMIPIFKPALVKANDAFDNAKIESHLFYKDDSGVVDYLKPTASFEEFNESLSSFYLEYIPFESPDKDLPITTSNGNEVQKEEYFTVKWYNETILKIDSDGKDLFQYQITSSIPDKNKIGILKEGVSQEDVSIFMQDALLKAMNNDFNSLPSINKLINNLEFLNQLTVVLSILPAGIIVYVMIPWILKNGQTAGKRAFGLGLASIDGYKFNSPMLMMRFMPTFVLLASLFIPIWNDLVLVFLVFLIVFLVSFTLSMSSPKRTALHDYCAQSIVVDLKTSTIFETVLEEEQFIANEDNIQVDEEHEEPEISYEK